MATIPQSEPQAMGGQSGAVTETEEELGGPKFYPCLYIQRYHYAQQQLSKHNITTLVDFGSAECKICRFLVQHPTLEKLSLVDLDGDLLEANKYMIRPLIYDYVVRREVTLEVSLYQGDVTQLDRCIVGCEAVSMVEIIEHLVPDVLDAAVDMVFGQLQPKVVVITTPNSDYNQLFPNFCGFRHWDHKFEWTQTEFQHWCDFVCSRHGYNVEYGGVGEPPPGSETLGYCSQAATFLRQKPYTPVADVKLFNTYRLIASSTYPCNLTSTLSEEDKMLMEVNYLIRQFNAGNHPHTDCSCSEQAGNHNGDLCYNCRCAGYQIEDSECLVPISYFMRFKVFNSKFDVNQVRLFLQNHGYRLTEDLLYVISEDTSIAFDDHDVENTNEDKNDHLFDKNIPDKVSDRDSGTNCEEFESPSKTVPFKISEIDYWD